MVKNVHSFVQYKKYTRSRVFLCSLIRWGKKWKIVAIPEPERRAPHLDTTRGAPTSLSFQHPKIFFYYIYYIYIANQWLPVPKFEILIRNKKLHIDYKNHGDSPKGRFWPFFLVRYLMIPVFRHLENFIQREFLFWYDFEYDTI